ncbi:MAG: hypothetical protein KI790_07080 [Cyclobacteriaceae bacterium]|nr:hypothetical protein [Cyclobacteriaceae bacterium HetDA_MAG_MS6]
MGSKANDLERLAAEELNHYLKSFAGLKLPIIDEAQFLNEDVSLVYIGTPQNHEEIRKLINAGVITVKETELGDYGYRIKTLQHQDKDLTIITAHTSKGVLNGVYAFLEEVIGSYTGLKSVDISYSLDVSTEMIKVPELDLVKKPYAELIGFEWEGMALDNTTLIDSAKRARAFSYWGDLITWGRRHKMNTITNWPYLKGKSSMNNFPDIVLLDQYKNISPYTDEEIKKGIVKRKEFLRYASENGMEPYLMIYVPGWVNKAIQKSYPQFVGELEGGEWIRRQGARPFAWSNPDVHQFMADLCREVVKTYPEITGLHLRVWGAESLPDAQSVENKTALIRVIIKKMVEAASEINPDLNIILSGYRNFEDHDFSYVESLPANIIIQRKWHTDWDVIPDAKVPDSWQTKEAFARRMISVSIPQEEAIPFWFPSARLFQKGLEGYISRETSPFYGFPINPRNWVVGKTENDLNFIAISKLSWDPFEFNYETYYKDFYTNLYGRQYADDMFDYTLVSMDIAEDFLADFAGIIEGMGIGNWERMHNFMGVGLKLFLDERKDEKKNQYTISKLDSLMSRQRSANQILEDLKPHLMENEYFSNTYFLSKALLSVFESRKTMVEIAMSDTSQLSEIKGLRDQLKQQNDELIKSIMSLTDLSCEERGQTVDEKKLSLRASFERELRSVEEYLDGLQN